MIQPIINPAYVESLERYAKRQRELVTWAQSLLCNATPNDKLLTEEHCKAWCESFGKWFAESQDLKDAAITDASALYHQLLYAVERKFEGESRHDTALRYIREAESKIATPEQVSNAVP